MNATVLAAIITGAAGLIGGAVALYFVQRRHNETREDEARRREDEAQSRADEAQSREDEARRQEEKAHRREAVAYLKSIAETIREMRNQLAESQIPRDFGHELIGLIDSEYYKGLLQPYLGDKTQPELDKLHRVQERVTEEDRALERGEVKPEKLKEVLAEMQRVEGDVRAQATRISPTENRAN
jgi:gas vesicle protein